MDLFSSSTTAASEAELLGRYRRHDPAAAGEVYERYGKLLFGLILNVVGDRQSAEELLAEILLAAPNALHAFEHNDFDLAPWLLITARNHALRFRGETVRVKEQAARWKALECAAVHQQSWPVFPPNGAVQQAFQALPEANRLVLELAWFEGMCLEEIASRLGVPVAAVVALAASSLARLREC